MLPIKVALRSMLSMPVMREVSEHYILIFGSIAYLSLVFLVLKTFQYNKAR